MMERKLNIYKEVSIYNNNNPIFVEPDEDRIIQVPSNPLSNAIKFTDQGKISINLFEKNDDNNEENGGRKEVIVSITDTGSGINSEIFKAILGCLSLSILRSC